MTEPDRPADAPAGPTPEEISARLEALLKRTHALKASKAAEPAAPLTITWPPPDRELDHYDVVDVPDDDRMTSPPPAAASPVAAAAPSSPPSSPSAATPPASEKTADSFARPDWSELRLRSVPDEPSGPSRGWIVLTVLFALVALGQAAYIWMGSASSAAEGRLRVDGPDGAVVRVNGQAIGPAPIDHVLAPGDYDVETGSATTRVSIGVGRTVVLLPATAAQSQTASSTPAVPSPAPPSAGSGVTAAPRTGRPEPPRPAAPASGATTNPAATAAAAVSARLGGVLIESTPSGLPVTMEGRERGVTPITIGQLKPGRHDVLVGGLARKVDVTAGSVASLRVDRP